MIFRFCLYGFLKNQQYYAPFILLAFREKGLSFFAIGVLLALRELSANLMEIPSGALADIYGRRRAMLFSMGAYIFSFLSLAMVEQYLFLGLAMLLFGLGDAFRSGTHKAIIMDYLARNGRLDEKTRVYGLTRSWSRIGSALSALIAAALVFRSGDYSTVFYWTLVPYCLGSINLFCYPRYFDESSRGSSLGLREHFALTWRILKSCTPLRARLLETMTWDGVYKGLKDYLQALLKALAKSQHAALLVGVVYCLLHLLESAASRCSHGFAQYFNDDEGAAKALWTLRLLTHVLLIAALYMGLRELAVLLFIALAVLQNLWRPVQVGRVQELAPPAQGATILSVDAQSKALGTLIFAPFLGWSVDSWGLQTIGILAASLSLIRLSLPGLLARRARD